MNRPTLNIGIIGCGRMGKIRAEATKNANQNILAAFDINNQMLSDFKLLFPNSQAIDKIDNFPWNNIDIIFICSPPSLHLTHISIAVKHKKAFFVEKPLSINAIEITRIIKEIETKQIINAVGYMNRYRASIQHIKNLPFLGVSSYWINKMYKVPWWENINESGGPLNEQATHLFDLYRYLIGDVFEVFANCALSNYSFPTTISVNLKFIKGQVGNILYSCDAKSKKIGMDLFTEEDKISLEGWDFNLRNQTFPILSAQDIFDLETKTFFNAVIENKQQLVLSDIKDALDTQFLVDAVNLSIKTRSVVNIKEFVTSNSI
ncbi:Gfo/Idh/MocA family protein [Daejeonella oryzae]|uniref:Gfo/Idh/MocA family protein n=1 Tax=Daejeonella oryzae TaxID=1122943 RepID=UPI00040EDD33|nr:Gfo/Idh/MocA family oxidoreductase [Daejeonella oryzae]